ncbi:GNAT family N-acetyltransferase [Actinocorallia libanotica]|uniref:N-acetyltransferase domain-containing protein n=1 Tax=Actinocorallia libanotica TaxID=46162 RepID=A0ABP4B803_9ACTN
MEITERGTGTKVRCPQGMPVRWFGELLVRRYLPEDHAEVLTLHREGLARIGLRPGDGVYYEHDLHRLEELYLRDGTGEFLVGLREGVPVAMGGLRRVDSWTGELVRLRVRPELQRHGYGAALLTALEDRAKELDYGRLVGDTTEFQGAALQLYRKFGWKETGRRNINGIVNIYGEKYL